MFIVEIVESFEIVKSRDGFGEVTEVESHESRKVVGIFHDRDRAEKCRRLQPEFVEDREGWEPQVIIREIDSDFAIVYRLNL